MPIRYTSGDKVISGLPLGGIGCGTLSVFPDGTRGCFTGLNNWEKPLGQLHWFRSGTAGDYRVSNPFAIFIKDGNKTVSKFLQTPTLDNCPTVEKIKFEGNFPFAKLYFKDKDIKLDISQLSFSPFIKNDSKNSALPCAIHIFKVKNTTEKKVTVSVLASAINAVGAWNVGRFNKVRQKNGLIGVSFYKKNSHPWDGSGWGNITLATKANKSVTYEGQWPYVRENFRGNAEDRCFQVWECFKKTGQLPNRASGIEAQGEGDEWMAALAVKFKLKPGEEKEIPFYYTWFMPNHYKGHMYQHWFGDSWDVAVYVDRKKEFFLDKTKEWQRTIERAPLGNWLKDALINYCSIITSSSWWTKSNEFVMYENPVKWPLMDSLDVRYYGTMPLAIFFPELEKNTMLLFKRFQRKDGRIPHDLGKSQIGCPSDGTTAGKPWKDLSTKYALMAYRDFLWTKDMPFLRRIYKSVKKAMEWEFSQDKDGNGLPDNEGKDQTYDLWDFYGTSSYSSSIYLASLLASMKMARLLGDRNFYRICENFFKRGRKSFEKELWSGSYYIAGRSKKEKYKACTAGQLNGQWYAHLLNLGYVLPEKHVKKAVRTIINLNGRKSRFGIVNSVYPDGKIDRASYHAENIWAGETYAFAGLAIYEGFIEEGLDIARRTWENFVYKRRNVWSQPDVVFARDGSLGDGELYVRNMAIWSIPFALARHDKGVKEFLFELEPKLAPSLN
ncbi:MAG: GH116 family glycosyl hydrolase [Omnitrophica bacterium]|nr:GH116 family glycosyl hydrolase [Candidatus Omnitrophota bacterium]